MLPARFETGRAFVRVLWIAIVTLALVIPTACAFADSRVASVHDGFALTSAPSHPSAYDSAQPASDATGIEDDDGPFAIALVRSNRSSSRGPVSSPGHAAAAVTPFSAPRSVPLRA